MTLEPLLTAPFAVQFHVATVVPAAIIGAILLVRRKGSRVHRLLGRLWIVLMMVSALSSLFIHELKIWGEWSPIHLLSLYVIAGCVSAYLSARRGLIGRHRRTVIGLYAGGIVVAGGFTFLPGRIMHAVVFSGSNASTTGLALVIIVPVLAALWLLFRRAAVSSVNHHSG